jgi:integrase
MDNMQDRRPEAFIFSSQRGTPLNMNNFLNRVIKRAAARARARMAQEGHSVPEGFLEGVNHQAFRRTCATHLQKLGTIKDVQAHLRHATPMMTVGKYMKQIPESVKAAVESLDQTLTVQSAAKVSETRRAN